jgi:DNA-binding NarL/FixJ family response regulator
MPTKILVVDDHQVVREGVRSILATTRPEWSLYEAADGIQALEDAQVHEPDVVVMDVTMPGLSGLEIASALRKKGFTRPILMFTMHKSDQLGVDAHQAGAQGYVLKSQAVADLVRAIDVLLGGGTFFGSSTAPEPSRDAESGAGFMLRMVLVPAF